MLEPLVFLISAILKAWHLLVAAIPGISTSVAWTASVILLLITVRAALVPTAYKQLLVGRKSVNLRPEFAAIKNKYARSADPNAPKYAKWAIQELQRTHDISLWSGLIPPLVQIPVFIGLYRMLRRMADAGIHGPTAEVAGVGTLSGDEVRDFASATFFGVPLPAYVSMNPVQLAELGTDFSSVISLCAPLILMAATFTGINMAISITRLRRTLDHGSRFMRGTYKYLIGVTGFAIAFPLFFGIFGPAPLAIIVYWVCNNLWTMSQNAIITIILERKYPLTPEFRAMRDQVRDARVRERTTRKLNRRQAAASRRTAIIGSILRPSTRTELWKSHRDMLDARDAAAREQINRQKQQQLAIAHTRQLARLLRADAQGQLPSFDAKTPVNQGYRRIRIGTDPGRNRRTSTTGTGLRRFTRAGRKPGRGRDRGQSAGA